LPRPYVLSMILLLFLFGCSSSYPNPVPAASGRVSAPSSGRAADGPTTTDKPEPSSPPDVRVDHLVVVVEENHSYEQIVDTNDAPYLRSLIRRGALFTDAHGVTHPSQPNYLALFSGSTQGVKDDSCRKKTVRGSQPGQRTDCGESDVCRVFGRFAEGGLYRMRISRIRAEAQSMGAVCERPRRNEQAAVGLPVRFLETADGVVRHSESSERHARRIRPPGRHMAERTSGQLRLLGGKPPGAFGRRVGRGRLLQGKSYPGHSGRSYDQTRKI